MLFRSDVATFPWIHVLNTFYNAAELTGMSSYRHVMRALETFEARPAVIKGNETPKVL